MIRSFIGLAFLAVLIAVGMMRTGIVLSGAPAAKAPRATANETVDVSAGIVTIDGDLQGHFKVTPAVNGARVLMLVDTGASVVALRHEDALAAGLRPKPAEFTQRLGTANGVAFGAPVRLRELKVGGITVKNVEAVIMPPGRLGISLLGMSFLKRLAGYGVERGRLRLQG